MPALTKVEKEEGVLWFRNYYKCEISGKKWTDDWTATSDDECPCHGYDHTPYKSEDIDYKGGPIVRAKRRNQKGFTLIELLLVLAMVAIIVAQGWKTFHPHG